MRVAKYAVVIVVGAIVLTLMLRGPNVSDDFESAARENRQTCEQAKDDASPPPEWCSSSRDNPDGYEDFQP